MAEEYHVTTVAEFATACERSRHDTDVIVYIDNDIDFNNSSYYERDADFFTVGYDGSNNKASLIIYGQGHTFSNIYLYPNRSLFVINRMQNAAGLTINDLTFEIISNNASVFYGTDYCSMDVKTINCTFNVKCYSFFNPLFYFTSYPTIRFERTIFNIYINTFRVDYTIGTESDRENSEYYYNGTIVNHRVGGGSYSTIRVQYQACIIRIRNRTNNILKAIHGGKYSSSSVNQNDHVKFDNCAIFYNDVGREKPVYDITANKYIEIIGNSWSDNPPNKMTFKFFNSFIAAFDQVDSNNKPLFLFERHRPKSKTDTEILTSFFDSDKIIFKGKAARGYNSADVYDLAASALTTEQCKDPETLSVIGYIFCEET
jgi:hypothetical protein